MHFILFVWLNKEKTFWVKSLWLPAKKSFSGCKFRRGLSCQSLVKRLFIIICLERWDQWLPQKIYIQSVLTVKKKVCDACSGGNTELTSFLGLWSSSLSLPLHLKHQSWCFITQWKTTEMMKKDFHRQALWGHLVVWKNKGHWLENVLRQKLV